MRRRHGRVITAALAAAVLLAPALSSGAALGAGPVVAMPSDRNVPSKQTVDRARAKASAAAQRVSALQTQVSAAHARLVTLGMTLSVVAEQYNGAVYARQQSRAKSDAAMRAASNAQQQLGAAQTDLSRFASAAYRSGGDLARLDAMLGANGPQDLMDQASTMNLLGDRQSSALGRVEVARAAAVVLQSQARNALAQQEAATAAVQAARDKAQSLVDEQQKLTDSLKKQQVSLTKQVAALTSTSERLAAQRAAGLAAIAAARAAAAVIDGGSGGGSSGVAAWLPVVAPIGQQQGTAAGAKKALAFARAQLGKPYVWAGAGPDVFDCSGLTMMAWRQGGVSMPHFAASQYAQGKKISLGQIRPGDLVFFAPDLTDYRTIEHVGMYIGGGMMIEAPHTGAFVRIASIQRPNLFGAARM